MAQRIARQFVDRLLARVDIVEVIGRAVTLKKAGRDFQGLCPFHAEKTPSFTVSPDKQFYHCFGCGQHGSAIGFVMHHGGLGFVEAVEDLAASIGMPVEYEGTGEPAAPDHGPLYAMLADAEKQFVKWLKTHPARERAVNYLKGRGLTGEIAKQFRIGYAPPGWDGLLTEIGGTLERERLLHEAGLIVEREGGGFYDRFRDRIMFPIHDRRGRCIAFGGRVIDHGEPKYLNSPETAIFHKRRELYGLDEVLKASSKLHRILIVEGYMDVVALAQHGVHNAVATLGTATSAEHLEQLFRQVPEIVFCFDGDAAGKRASWRALEVTLPLMQDGRTALFMFLPQGQDPDSWVRQAGRTAFAEGGQWVRLSELLFNELSAQTDLKTLEGRARLAALAKPLIQKVPGTTLRQLLLEHLANLAQTRVTLGADRPRQNLAFARKPPSASTAPGQADGAEPSDLPAPRPLLSTKRKSSRLDHALAMLLRQPSLAGLAKDFPALDVASDPRVALLIHLLETLHTDPQITSGALVERYRDTAYGELVESVLSQRLVLSSDLWETEFAGTLAQIRKDAQRSSFQRTLGEGVAGPGGLSQDVRKRLQHKPLSDG